MKSGYVIARVVLLATSALVAGLAAGCETQNGAISGSTVTGQSANSSTTQSANTATSTSALTPGTPDTPPQNTAPTQGATLTPPTPHNPPTVAACKAANLKANLGRSDGAAGSTYSPIQFTNTGSTSCVISGFPGVSYVTGDNGQQVGAPADRDGAPGPVVTLAPGSTASATVRMIHVGVYDAGQCQPTPVRGLRVYPPDDTAALFIPLTGDATGCGNATMRQLAVQTVQAGPGGP